MRSIRVTPERLDGLPADWIEAHPADDEGLVTVTTDYPDAVPVRMFAHDAEVRRDLTVQFLTRGWPQNEPLLTELFALRHELATLVGYADWASYDADVKMIGTGPAIPEFIDRIAAAAEEPMRRDLEAAAGALPPRRPRRAAIDSADGSYYQELVRQEQYDVDSQEVRTYFAFAKVHAGTPRRDRSAVRAALRAGHRRRAVGRRRHGLRRARRGRPLSTSAGSSSTCTRGRASSTTPRSSP